ncbi:hypothetical protein [Thiosulfatihalobacter marinus]|uniref:hypothetical protein n=1 Tax=Thiosulfatihalobacter marinus TaxID=2792481 RepID=UPI0018D8B7E6|nr:hypothetical protein [Thiosulfatihalobacter marinus]
MYTLGFGIIWTLVAFACLIAFSRQDDFQAETTLYKVLMTLMPFAGFLVIWDGWRKLRRFRSVREEDGMFVWTELDGSEQRSDIDPRIVWDKEDRNFSDN